MPAVLSGNTLGLKFMQRGAAAKAATEARKQEEAKKHAAETKQATQEKARSSDEDTGDSSEEDDSSDDDREQAVPVASTSKLPSRHQPSITTESSYLAFPILSSAYGVASTSEGTSAGANGRFSFGQQPKKQKQRKPKSENLPSESDDENSRKAGSKSRGAEKKEKKIYSISNGGSASANKPVSIREQQRARASAEANRKTEGSTISLSEDEGPLGNVKYEEDSNFVDDMMQQARQKRQLDASQRGRKKPRKSAD